MIDIDMAFPESLKILRASKSMGQKDLAKVLNTTVKTVSHWETGYSEPSITQLIFMADYFEITIDELVDRKSKNF